MKTRSTSGAKAKAKADTRAKGQSDQEKARDAMQDYSITMQRFTKNWFERRHEGANAALQASRRMLAARNPAEAIAQYQDWLRGAMEHTMADAKALQDQIANMAQNAQERRNERENK